MRKVGVLLMTYGSPEQPEDVEEYLMNIRRGKAPDPALVREFQRRYEAIGGSPLTKLTREQARAVAGRLNAEKAADVEFKPYVGMRYWRPYIRQAVEEMDREGITEAVGLIMSPQYSPLLMKGYIDAVEEARERTRGTLSVSVVGDWWHEELFQRAVARRIIEALEALPEGIRGDVPLLLTAHSLPRSVYEREPDYVEQLRRTAEAIAGHVRHPWRFAYQSAGHTREEWLRPDLTDLFPEFARQGHRDVVVCPIQFLADHLEILYDIDVAAREQAAEAGLELHRTESLNLMPEFIEALANIVRRHAAGMAA